VAFTASAISSTLTSCPGAGIEDFADNPTALRVDSPVERLSNDPGQQKIALAEPSP